MTQVTIQQAFDMAIQHHQAGRLDQAEKIYRQILAQQPGHAGALHHLGLIATQVGRPDVALDLIRQAVAINPAYADAHGNLGNVLWEQGQLDEAIAAYRQAIALKPGFSEAYYNLGGALKDQGHLDEAIAAYRQAFRLKPSFVAADSNVVYTLHFHPDFDAQAIYQELRRWNEQHAEPLRQFIQPHLNDRSPDRRLKIGYVSPDFREHPVGRFLLPLLAQHDKEQFEVFAYAQVARPDILTEQFRVHCDGWRSLVGLSDEQAAQLIRDDQIDILVDLTMHMADNRLLVFARKPAPVQVTYLAYCSTTGLRTIDYRLSDPFLDPPGGDESVYSELTWRLPQTYWCYQPVHTPPLGPVPALSAGHITFGCLNNFCKVTGPTLSTWASLLQAVPNSQLLLHTSSGTPRQRSAELLQRMGVAPQRLRFVGSLPMSEYMQLYQEIDIVLDPFPYGGGTTTCDALWMGVPVVSLAGKTGVGRGGLSILSNIGLPELVADSEERYVRIAADLAKDLGRLRQLRSTLRGRMERSPLMDAGGFARGIEAAYRAMWRKWCANASPS